MAKNKKNSNYATAKNAEKNAVAEKKKNSKKSKAQAKRIILGSVVAVLVLASVFAGLYFGGAFAYVPEATEHVSIELDGYSSTLHVELYRNDATATVKNFLTLVNTEYFNGKFVNAYKDGNLYLGDEKSDFENGILGEFALNGKENKVPFEVGTLVMARGDDYNSAYGRFFIVTKDTDIKSLEGKYAAFGKITDGMEVIEAIIASVKPGADGRISVSEQVEIHSISTHEH